MTTLLAGAAPFSLNSVKNFKVLALTCEGVDEEGVMKFAVRELYTLKKLTPKRPLVVTMVFYGDLPNNGISYVDAKGITQRFAVGLSGEDGSLQLVKF